MQHDLLQLARLHRSILREERLQTVSAQRCLVTSSYLSRARGVEAIAPVCEKDLVEGGEKQITPSTCMVVAVLAVVPVTYVLLRFAVAVAEVVASPLPSPLPE